MREADAVSFPALMEAGNDPLLVQRGSVAAVYLHLVGRLDFVEFRRLRASRVATDLCLRAETVGAALKLLREAGYVVRGPRVLEVFTYRLVFARDRDNVGERSGEGVLKGRARKAVFQALADGTLKRPDRCSRCHGTNPDGSPVHGHHKDYRKPLEVEWLCRSCHGRVGYRSELSPERKLKE